MLCIDWRHICMERYIIFSCSRHVDLSCYTGRATLLSLPRISSSVTLPRTAQERATHVGTRYALRVTRADISSLLLHVVHTVKTYAGCVGTHMIRIALAPAVICRTPG